MTDHQKIVQEIIPAKLKEIESRENIRVIHCVESGSRAWGFASPDSDYDVRFIYVRPLEYYLRLDKTRDVIEWQLDDTLDINGWDLQKALRLLHSSNPTLFEWNNSPIIYKTTPQWAAVSEIIGDFFQKKAMTLLRNFMKNQNFVKIKISFANLEKRHRRQLVWHIQI